MSRLLRIGVDLVLVLMATIAAILLRTDLDIPSPDLVRYIPYLGATAIIAVLSMGAFKLDVGVWRHASIRDILVVLAVAALTAFGSTATIFAVNRLGGIARTIPLLQFIFTILTLLAPRLIARCMTGRQRSTQFTMSVDAKDTTKNVLVVGFNAMSALYVRSLVDLGDRDLKVAGLIGLKPRETGRYMGQVPVLGTADRLSHIIADLAVHGVVVDRLVLAVLPRDLSARGREELLAVEVEYGLPIEILAEKLIGADRTGVCGGPVPRLAAVPDDARSESIAETPFETRELAALAASGYWRTKRVLDVIGALVLIVVLAPVAAIAAVAAIVDTGFPLLFWQVRLGMGGSTFRLLKLRTMSPACDPHGDRVPDDERTSPVGALLRRIRVDELPQLWNVLVGDMSLIGPRPLLAGDQPSYESGRLLVRPGLTGWAQVCGGRHIGPDSKAVLDVWYIRNASFALDLRIVAATIRMLLIGDRVACAKIERAQADLDHVSAKQGAAPFQPLSSLAARP